jgi:beta-lactam-binding protein with PASTA domain
MLKALLTSSKFYITVAIIAIVGAITLFLMDTFVMPVYTNYDEGVTVPDITKQPLAKAEAQLTDYGLRFEVVDRRSHSAYPADYVIDQTPSAMQIVKPNRKIYLTVNTAVQPMVIVPEVVNLSLRNAEIQLQNYGLKKGVVSYASSRFKNSVLRQSIQPGIRVAKGTVIDLTVSDGLGVKQVAIPDIIGLRLPQAQQKLREVGLRTGQFRFEPTQEYEANVVLSHSAANQDSIVIGSKLDMTISERGDAREADETGAVIADSTREALPDSLQKPQQPEAPAPEDKKD